MCGACFAEYDFLFESELSIRSLLLWLREICAVELNAEVSKRPVFF